VITVSAGRFNRERFTSGSRPGLRRGSRFSALGFAGSGLRAAGAGSGFSR